MNREEFEAAIFKMIDYAKKMSDIGDEIARKCNWDQDMCSLLRKIEAGDVTELGPALEAFEKIQK